MYLTTESPAFPVSSCPSPGCPERLRLSELRSTLACPTHGPMKMACVHCGKSDGRTEGGAIACHDCAS